MVDGELTVTKYRERKGEVNGRSVPYLTNHVGSWNEAKELAGLTTNHSTSPRSVDEDYFSELNAESAYWAGFIFGDGSIENRGDSSRLRIALQGSDREHLELLKQHVSSEHTIQQRVGPHQNNIVCINIGGKQFVDSLKNIGITENKSKGKSVPDVPKEYFGCFIRGYFDADGNMDQYPQLYAKSLQRLQKIAEWFPCEVYVHDNHRTSARLTPSIKNQEIREFYKFLYPEATSTSPMLDRKHQSFLDHHSNKLQ